MLAAGRADGVPPTDIDSLVGLADNVGLDTLRALWRGAEPVSLASALWMLYLLRSWCLSATTEVLRLWKLGEPVAAADAVVAGLDPLADEASIAVLADSILRGAFTGDFAVALERAAAVFRVLGAGRRELPSDPELELADRNDRAADALARAARQWRADALH